MSLRKLQKTRNRIAQFERYTSIRSEIVCRKCHVDNLCSQEEINPQDSSRTSASKQDVLKASECNCQSQALLQQNYDADSRRLDPFERRLPYYVSCFSPLGLPSCLFVHLMGFLNGGDLWKLCQVSTSLRNEILKFMPKAQRLEFEIVRILRQQLHYSQAERYRLALEKQSDERSDRQWRIYRTHSLDIPTPPAEVQLPGVPLVELPHPDPHSSLGYPSTAEFQNNRGELRDNYWALQTENLLAAIVEDTPYEIGSGARSETEVAESTEISPTTHPANVPQGDNDPAPAANLPNPLEHGQFLNFPAFEGGTLNVARNRIRQFLQRATENIPPLPMRRFMSVVNVLFDPNLVILSHRRAVVNCARYIAAEIETAFEGMVSTTMPRDAQFCATFKNSSRVDIGPYLRILLPFDEDQDAGIPLHQRALRPDTVVFPPQELNNYIQVMLWRRCLQSLIELYNRIHHQHNLAVSVNTSSSPLSTQSLHYQQKEQEQDRGIQEEAITLRRFRMEERNRNDTLIKQELLSLCHMACGLFMAPVAFNADGEPISHTIMTHLRLGSPWQKGVWREGEWRYAPIDIDHDLDEVSMAHRLGQERERQLEEGLSRRSGASESDIQDRLERLFNISPRCYGREGKDDTVDNGPWQRLCLATIHFLIDEDLQWAGNTSNRELNKLRVTDNDDAWFYFI
ncbi:hypothetical protein BGZ65_008133 [Modicella reniformis]|uniref:F-box domain-containing protein n=1 Tax=Modicella reniformis TaxID=1440133 RepID=A0A9P6MKU5_9FUNG|nr:hypothetical protein BGZ65_008133 [Modicella reniformis]